MEIDPHNLPKEAGILRQIVLQLLGVVEEQDRLLERVQHQLQQLLRQRYGPKRERIDENQLFLFAAQIIAAARQAKAAEPGAQGSGASGTTRRVHGKGHGRKPLPASLERRRVVFDLEEAQRQCRDCQKSMQRIGEDVSERLEFVPASLHVIEEVRPKYACVRGCGVVAAPKPAAAIEKGLPGPGLLAQVAVSKYGDHLPLYRLEGIFRRQGVELSRQTMCDWMGACAELVSPVRERMKQVMLTSKAVQTDDTPVPVLDAELTRTRTGRIWTYVGDRNHPYIVYDYTGNRRGQGPAEFLRSYRGYLQADAYPGYDAMFKNRYGELIEVLCWAHVRRYFYEAQAKDVARATVVLAYVGLLYDVEREARDCHLNADQRLALRQARSRPILEDIKNYLEAEKPKVLPKSLMEDAIDYTLKSWTALLCYCQDGDLEIDNNGAERSLRSIVIGRKNWLFYGSDAGGRTGAVLSTLIASCTRQLIDPFAYLRDLFARIAAHPQNQLDELLPDRWQLAHSSAQP
ncbi:MAG: IS66 family transposase [Acidobacteria bacterium]|nr:MAG: IS66 family transposase [Acidobacteriota bacterium]